MIKQAPGSVELYDKGGRAELAAQEARGDRDHLSLSPKADVGGRREGRDRRGHCRDQRRRHQGHGKVIGALKAKYTGQMDFGKASAW